MEASGEQGLELPRGELRAEMTPASPLVEMRGERQEACGELMGVTKRMPSRRALAGLPGTSVEGRLLRGLAELRSRMVSSSVRGSSKPLRAMSDLCDSLLLLGPRRM